MNMNAKVTAMAKLAMKVRARYTFFVQNNAPSTKLCCSELSSFFSFITWRICLPSTIICLLMAFSAN